MSQPQLSERPPTMANRIRTEAGLVGHGIARMLSPQSLWQGVKTLSWLGPLTLLIWIYAEQGQKRDLPGEVIPISVRANDPKVFVELRMPNEESAVTADLSGPAGQLDEVRRKIQPGESSPTLPLTVPSSLPPGKNILQVAPLLRANSIFASSNVQIVKCNPETIEIYVDALEDRDLEVKKPEALKNIDSAFFDPPTVHVRAPSELFKKSTRLEAQLTEAANIDKSGDNKKEKVRVKLVDLTPSQAKSVSYLPQDTVIATFSVKENAEAKFKYPSIPILTLGPPLLLSKYDVVYDQDKDTLPNVWVIGPAEKIAALQKTADTRPEELPKPRAILEVTGDDQRYAGQSSRTRQLKFDRFPDPSIRIAPESEKSDVTFHIVERTTSQ